MTETENHSTQSGDKQFAIQKVYVKDLSFETPNTPEIFKKNWEPEVNMQMGNKFITIGEGVHEVTLIVTLTAKIGKKTAYLVEVQQAGIFTIQGFEQSEFGNMVGNYCLNILFPFARETICDLVTRGGFPQQLLPPVNFDALYKEALSQKQQQEQQAQNQSPQAETKH
ncbi:MAG: protein-export chaperone SecB [Gammaproteobacteria bacterium]